MHASDALAAHRVSRLGALDGVDGHSSLTFMSNGPPLYPPHRRAQPLRPLLSPQTGSVTAHGTVQPLHVAHCAQLLHCTATPTQGGSAASTTSSQSSQGPSTQPVTPSSTRSEHHVPIMTVAAPVVVLDERVVHPVCVPPLCSARIGGGTGGRVPPVRRVFARRPVTSFDVAATAVVPSQRLDVVESAQYESGRAHESAAAATSSETQRRRVFAFLRATYAALERDVMHPTTDTELSAQDAEQRRLMWLQQRHHDLEVIRNGGRETVRPGMRSSATLATSLSRLRVRRNVKGAPELNGATDDDAVLVDCTRPHTSPPSQVRQAWQSTSRERDGTRPGSECGRVPHRNGHKGEVVVVQLAHDDEEEDEDVDSVCEVVSCGHHHVKDDDGAHPTVRFASHRPHYDQDESSPRRETNRRHRGNACTSAGEDQLHGESDEDEVLYSFRSCRKQSVYQRGDVPCSPVQDVLTMEELEGTPEQDARSHVGVSARRTTRSSSRTTTDEEEPVLSMHTFRRSSIHRMKTHHT